LGSADDAEPSPSGPDRAALESVHLRRILDDMQLAAVFLDAGGRVVYCNRHLRELLGCLESEVVGQDWFERFVPEDQREATRESFLGGGEAGAPSRRGQSPLLGGGGGERRLISWSTSVLRDAAGRAVGSVSIGADITDLKRAEERLRHGALYDALTGLPNRSLFTDRVAGCLARAKLRPEYRFAALFLDLDRFKLVNNSLGHVAGDKLLVEVSRRFDECLRPVDFLARLGGDEFAILIDDMSDAQFPARVAGRIQAALGAPFQAGEREVYLSASIGIALNKPRYEGPEDFMRDGDTAMHHAKAQGKARHEVFETAMHARAMVQLEIENDLRRAVERGEISVHYQPILSVKSGAVAGFEALARWQRQGRGFVPPTDFVRIAEEAGLIGSLGAWVLREACRQIHDWQSGLGSQRPPLRLSVNLSARQFAEPDLVAQVTRSVRECGLAPGSLTLEITESVLMEEPEAAAATLAELRRQQIGVCIDDFGTGYSSLSYLLRFPAQTLKIDRSFVGELSGDKRHSEMVRTIVVLARNLGMDVIAEGVETEEQLARLVALDCDYVQGYLISRPLDAEAAEKLLRGAAPLRPPASSG
jgi:diguanylate cyclase (GGDEF)-like protein/PAS domain S-box-containing protein